MPWIESHQSLKDHPKLINLCQSMMWDVDCGIGKLSRFWWWCLDYAPDGDLSKFNDGQVAHAMGVAIRDSAKLVEAMVASRWIDRTPYFRVHDWWDYVGRYLKIKWKDYPEKWQAVKEKYTGSQTAPVTAPVTSPATPSTYLPTYQAIKREGVGAREPVRLHGIPGSEGEVVIYGATLNPPISEDRCKAFWGHYEGQARTNPNGDLFWITSGETVVTNWKAKLPSFGHQKANGNGAGGKPQSTPAWKQAQILEDQIKTHPANQSFIGHSADKCTPAMRAELTQLRTRLKELKAQEAQAA